MKRTLQQGERSAPWHGAAYYDHMHRRWVTYPIPLNLIVAVVRRTYLWMRCPPWLNSNDSRDAYRQGYLDGRRA